MSFGRDDGSDMRQRLRRGVRPLPRRAQPAATAPSRSSCASSEIDIAVDLKGYTQDSRPDIFAFRPAPIQVSYLGYPGHHGRRLHRLHHRRQRRGAAGARGVLHARRSSPCRTATSATTRSARSRREAPTPARGGPARAGLRVLLLQQQLQDHGAGVRHLDAAPARRAGQRAVAAAATNAGAEANLRREAQARGVDPARLVFARPARRSPSIWRATALADLFLDTLPYNAHTTASDALWAGLPVLTCRGTAFAARVAASLLHGGRAAGAGRPTTLPTTRRWRCGSRPTRRCSPICASGSRATASPIRCSTPAASAATSRPPTRPCGTSMAARRTAAELRGRCSRVL